MNLIRTAVLINEAKMRCQCLRSSQVNELSFLPIYSLNRIFWGSLLSQNIQNSPPPGPSNAFETAVCRQIIYRDLVKCRFWLWVQDSVFLTGSQVMLMLLVPDTHLEWQGSDHALNFTKSPPFQMPSWMRRVYSKWRAFFSLWSQASWGQGLSPPPFQSLHSSCSINIVDWQPVPTRTKGLSPHCQEMKNWPLALYGQLSSSVLPTGNTMSPIGDPPAGCMLTSIHPTPSFIFLTVNTSSIS